MWICVGITITDAEGQGSSGPRRVVINHSAFRVESWAVRETELCLDVLAETESLFALANGHIGVRGNLDEGEPFGLPGTYLAGFYESRPLPYPEGGYGYPEAGQAIVNVTNGKIIRLLVEDEPFDIRFGELRHHERVLDLRAGVLRRTVEWVSPTGCAVRVASTRLVSFSQRAIMAVLYEVELLDGEAPVVVQSELVANEQLPPSEDDPRATAGSAAPLASEWSFARDQGAVLVHSTQASGLLIGAAMAHVIDGPPDTDVRTNTTENVGRVSITATVAPGRPLRLVKFVAYGWSGHRSLPAIRDQVAAALREVLHTGWDGLVSQQRAYLDDFWDGADVELEGDSELQQAVRFAIFHVLQAGARAERRPIAAKGLTGPGYDGHTFWDAETFVLPALTYTSPKTARDALLWRHLTLDLARERARLLGLQGAAFPWRTIRGEECSGYWPASTAAFHVNADIADAVMRYVMASDDQVFARGAGLELLVETARLWRSLGHFDAQGRFRIDGVTGPDEYSAIADNNVYTNLMAERNLRAAAAAADANPDSAAALGVGHDEVRAWRSAAGAMFVPYDAELGVHPQSDGYTQHDLWNFDATSSKQYPLFLNFPYFELYRKQVVKQADLVLAMHVRGDAFTQEEKARNFAYYERLTVRDSSLSACTQAIIAAEVGQLDLAYDYFAEAARIDLDDVERNTRDGVHVASLAGTWLAAIAGFGGMRDHDGNLTFAPRLPAALTRMAFRLSFRGRRLLVEAGPEHATYSLLSGPPLEIAHHGESALVVADRPISLQIPPSCLPREPIRQPSGRTPARRASLALSA
jgi:alpha,alpha-trehalose phosphorylase